MRGVQIWSSGGLRSPIEEVEPPAGYCLRVVWTATSKGCRSPATSMELPPAATTYAQADPTQAIATGEKHGIKILTPAEALELLPHYPGFGLPRAQRSG
jgi:hypothetical protein